MNAISLWQPWASAMALGFKKNETRQWQMPERCFGTVAIHASKRKDMEARAVWEEFIDTRKLKGQVPEFDDLPFGAFVCVVCFRGQMRTRVIRDRISADEYDLGNYEDDRWAWTTRNIWQFKQPIPWVGRQGFFTVPDEVIKAAVIPN